VYKAGRAGIEKERGKREKGKASPVKSLILLEAALQLADETQ
jgi:hypothetical protein